MTNDDDVASFFHHFCYLIKSVSEPTFSNIIVFVWSQYNGANIEQIKIGYGWCQNQEAKAKDCGRRLSWIQQTRS